MNITAVIWCVECDGPLVLRASGGTRFERRAVLDCPACKAEHVMVIQLRPSEPNRVAKCPSTGGYSAHLRKGEDPCAGCRDAHTRYVAATRASRKKVAA